MSADPDDFQAFAAAHNARYEALERLLRLVREHAATEASAGNMRAALREYDAAHARTLREAPAEQPKKPATKRRKRA